MGASVHFISCVFGSFRGALVIWDGVSAYAQWRICGTLRAWYGDGILLIDAAPGLDASSKLFVGEQQSRVKHV